MTTTTNHSRKCFFWRECHDIALQNLEVCQTCLDQKIRGTSCERAAALAAKIPGVQVSSELDQHRPPTY
ncbi:MAG: hypothetical protein ACYC6N_18780 [Pirellulaceae bacterium]